MFKKKWLGVPNITPTSPSEGILLHSERLIKCLFLFIVSAFTEKKKRKNKNRPICQPEANNCNFTHWTATRSFYSFGLSLYSQSLN